MTLWQVRTRVRDIPGKLAQLATALGAVRGNVVGIDVHGCDLEHVHDDLFVDVPETIDADRLAQALAGADDADRTEGPDDAAAAEPVRVRRARAQDLVDGPSQALILAARLVEDPAALPGLLCQLVGADGADLCGQAPPESPHQLVVGWPARPGFVVVRREWAPFTLAERARADRLVAVAAAVARAQANAGDLGVLCGRIPAADPARQAGGAGHVADLLARCSRWAGEARFVADDGERLPVRWLDRLAAPPEGFTLLAFAESGDLVRHGPVHPSGPTPRARGRAAGRGRVATARHRHPARPRPGPQGPHRRRDRARRDAGTAAQAGIGGTERLFARAGLPVRTKYADGVWEARARLRTDVRGGPVSPDDVHSAVLRGEAAVRAWARSTQ